MHVPHSAGFRETAAWNRQRDRGIFSRNIGSGLDAGAISWQRPPVSSLRSLRPPCGLPDRSVDAAAEAWIRRCLTHIYPEGLSNRELLQTLRWKLGRSAPSNSQLSAWLKDSSLSLDRRSGVFREKAASLTHMADRCERALAQAGRPLHYLKINRAIGIDPSCAKRPGHSAVTRMAADDRFVSFGRSGYWALAAWPTVEAMPVQEIIFETLKASGGPLSEKAILDQVSAWQPVARSSIAGALFRDNRFIRAGTSKGDLAPGS